MVFRVFIETSALFLLSWQVESSFLLYFYEHMTEGTRIVR